jgi:hypothetical protein
MGLTDGVDVLIADEPETMAAAIETLNSDDMLWNSLSKAGLDYVSRTTSRQAGYAIVADILDKLGLARLDRDSRPSAEHQHSAAFGSPGVLFDVKSLLAAATTKEPAGGVLFVPRTLQDARVEGWRVELPGELRAPADRVVAIVDMTNDAEIVEVARILPKAVAAEGKATIVFVPPRLVAAADGYSVSRPFENKDVTAPIQPPQERHQALLSALGGTLCWRVDTTLLGFPAIMMVDWRPNIDKCR